MFTSKKILTAALVALTLAGAAVASTGSAQAGGWHHRHHGGGWGWGAGGLAAGLIIGSTLSSGPAYAEPVYVERERRCFYVERVNRWNEVIGTRRVCR